MPGGEDFDGVVNFDCEQDTIELSGEATYVVDSHLLIDGARDSDPDRMSLACRGEDCLGRFLTVLDDAAAETRNLRILDFRATDGFPFTDSAILSCCLASATHAITKPCGYAFTGSEPGRVAAAS